jgi:hypothetical protein
MFHKSAFSIGFGVRRIVLSVFTCRLLLYVLILSSSCYRATDICWSSCSCPYFVVNTWSCGYQLTSHLISRLAIGNYSDWIFGTTCWANVILVMLSRSQCCLMSGLAFVMVLEAMTRLMPYTYPSYSTWACSKEMISLIDFSAFSLYVTLLTLFISFSVLHII